MTRVAKVLVAALFLFLGSFGLSHAIFYDFNNAVTTGSPVTPDNYSEKWNPTEYYAGSVAGWMLSDGAYIATNGAGDKAILLNEVPAHGSIVSTSITGLTAGTNYWLTFDHWGDNRPNDPGYTFTVTVDGVTSTILRDYNYSVPGGTGSFATEKILFTASGSSIVLSFIDATTAKEASAIIDNVRISAVPIPAAAWLLGSGLIGLIGIRRRFKK